MTGGTAPRERLTLYGCEDCSETLRARAALDGLGVAYRYVDIEVDTMAQDFVRQSNGGDAVTPMLTLGEERYLVDFGDPNLGELLRGRGYTA